MMHDTSHLTYLTELNGMSIYTTEKCCYDPLLRCLFLMETNNLCFLNEKLQMKQMYRSRPKNQIKSNLIFEHVSLKIEIYVETYDYL